MPEGNMFARLCNPTTARRFKLRPFSHAEGAKRRHSWGSAVAQQEEEVSAHVAGAAGGVPRQRTLSAGSNYSSEDDDDEWPGHKELRHSLDLLETCWTLERSRLQGDVSETESEPAREPSPEVGGMGQRASSTSSLHVKPPPTTTAPGRVSLTWALLKRPPSTQPSVVLTSSTPASVGGRSSSRGGRQQVAQPQQEPKPEKDVTRATPRVSSKHRSHHRSESSIKRFGYDIHDVDEFLSKASLQSPANIPVVLSTPSVLYQPGARRGRSGRGSWRQSELSLPLGMVVNAVFRSHAWLYVHTPHGEAGYVRYRSCLPLGILPQPPVSTPGTPAPGAWDTHTDTFPPPPPPSSSRARRGATSVCDVRHRRNKTDTEKLRDTVSECGVRTRHRRHRTHRPEEVVDKLFLASQSGSRAESECAKYPSKHQSSIAHRTSIGTLLKDIDTTRRRHRSEVDCCSAANIDTVSVKDSVSQCGVKYYKQKYAETKSLPSSTPPAIEKTQKTIKHKTEPIKIISGYHSNHNTADKLPLYRTVAQQTDFIPIDNHIDDKDVVSEVGKSDYLPRETKSISESGVKTKESKRHTSKRSEVRTETLLLIRSDYNSRGRNTLSVSKGDVVVLVSGTLKDWFWVRRGDGCEGFIPSVVAGHGFL